MLDPVFFKTFLVRRYLKEFIEEVAFGIWLDHLKQWCISEFFLFQPPHLVIYVLKSCQKEDSLH
ncbi:hypothetical protein BLL40_10640 [Domibacillus mangrovi]|uniref:Uncharacterized protein n=1 Tax=Domibacillus mangrovi TaxID=1714354 RepID=A0A1Q5P263_9BACI|nr:hypothetical protein BLL40_10640 [Domibacillus mangrovi]